MLWKQLKTFLKAFFCPVLSAFFFFVPTFFHPNKGIYNGNQALRCLWGHLLLLLISFPTHHQPLSEPEVLQSRENATLQEWKWPCISIPLLIKYHSFSLFFSTFKLDDDGYHWDRTSLEGQTGQLGTVYRSDYFWQWNLLQTFQPKQLLDLYWLLLL